MAKPVKTQWDFGELFPAEALRKTLTVSELTGQVKRLLERQVGKVWVTGEITNCRVQSSGHCYFTLKDASAQLACVLFRGENVPHRELLQDGRQVDLHGELTVYEARGQHQLRVTEVELHGVGALQQAFELLKQKLAAEGLFAPERKRSLPRYPETIAVITSPTGAALQDVLHVIERRHAALRLILVPCTVQGRAAAGEIAASLRLVNDWAARVPAAERPGLILLTRGGGSLEDLWAFNEEPVARAIFESTLPVISAVGHEIDFTISDFVADFRAATPSAAAEIITEHFFASRQYVFDTDLWLRQQARRLLNDHAEHLLDLGGRVGRAHPRRRLQERQQRVDDLSHSFWRCAVHHWRAQQSRWGGLRQRLQRVRPAQLLQLRAERLAGQQARLHQTLRRGWEQRRQVAAHLERRLRLLSPEQVLARGYSITRDEATGRVLRSTREVQAGQRLVTRLQHGEVRSVAVEKSPETGPEQRRA